MNRGVKKMGSGIPVLRDEFFLSAIEGREKD